MRDDDGMYGEEPAHMKDYDALAKDWSDSERKYAQQVADLQAEVARLRAERNSAYATSERFRARLDESRKEVARLRTALLAWKIECAAFSLHDGESQIERTRAARIEARIAGILEAQ